MRRNVCGEPFVVLARQILSTFWSEHGVPVERGVRSFIRVTWWFGSFLRGFSMRLK